MKNWQRDRTMTARQFRGTVKAMGMTQAAAGRFLGVSERTLRRFVSGDAAVPTAAVLLLRSMQHHNDVPLVPEVGD